MFSIPHVDAMPSGVLPIPTELAQSANNTASLADTQSNSQQSTFTVLIYGIDPPR
jgi:hypothetical protein